MNKKIKELIREKHMLNYITQQRFRNLFSRLVNKLLNPIKVYFPQETLL
jgi:hypothetical protein